jgi:hypothetical protein
MSAAAEYLLRAGSSGLFAGMYLWVILFLVAAFRDPRRSDLIAWSIGTQWVATGRILRRAAGYRVWSRLATAGIALGAACLILAGLAAAIGPVTGATGNG